MARPKSEATRISYLESSLATMTSAYESAAARAREQHEILFSMYIILGDLRDSENDGLGAYLHALHLMAEKGTDI